MSHVLKLQLRGHVCGDRKPPLKVQSYYSWPLGERQSVVNEIIEGYKKAFCNVSVIITHNLDI